MGVLFSTKILGLKNTITVSGILSIPPSGDLTDSIIVTISHSDTKPVDPKIARHPAKVIFVFRTPVREKIGSEHFASNRDIAV